MRFLTFLFLMYFVLECYAENETGFPIRFIGGCEADFNGDKITDRVLLYETSEGVELVALILPANSVRSFLLLKSREKNLNVSCKYFKTVRRTMSGKDAKENEVIEVNSIGIELKQPESSTTIFYWNDNCFKQVWTSD